MEYRTILATCLLLCPFVACSQNVTSSEGGKVKTANTTAPPAVGVRGSTPPAPAKPASSMPQLSGEHHPVFSLADNRLLAHLMRQQGLFIALGHPGLAKHLNFNRPWSTWELNQKEDERSVALADRSVSWLNFPLSQQQASAAQQLVLRLKSPKAQGLRARLNGHKLDSVRLSQGWQSARIAIPAGAVRAGENRLELSWNAMGRLGRRKAAAAVEWIYLGPQQPETIDQVQPARNGKLVLPADGGVAYYIQPYADTKLRLRFKAQPPAQRCELRAEILPAQGKPLQQSRSETALAAGTEAETFVDLAPVAGRPARLELWASGAGCKELVLEEAALVRPGRTPAAKHTAPPRNVLFWMIDNVRADRYKLYNPETRVKTPTINRLGQSGTVFAKAYIQGTESRVSHATIWTGLYPKQHRFVAPKAKLNLGWVTLSEAAQKAGLFTAAWIANGFVSKFWGFGEGWNAYRNTLHRGGGLTAKRLAEHSIQFIKEQGDKPFYLYVGTIDPHVSWRGRQPWLKEYYPEPYDGLYTKNVYGKDVEKMATGARKVSEIDRRRIIAIYDSTVSYNDHHLGLVLKALEHKGIRDQTMIVITADHGEELWDFGRIGHGHSLRDPIVAVPLIIHYPPLFGSGARVEQGVDVASLMPTILDALGAQIPEAVQSESLLPLAQGVGTGYPRPSIATQYELAHTIRLERWKLWIGGKGDIRFFDLESRAGEHREIGNKAPVPVRWLTDALSTFMTYQHSWRVLRWGVASNHKAALADDLEAGKLEPIKP